MNNLKTFNAAFILDAKRLLFIKKTIVLLFFFSLFSLYLVQMGTFNYKNIIHNKEKFQDIEGLKVNQYVNYSQYGTYGFRILFIPSPLGIFFYNSTTILDLTANVDSGERLNIYNSLKGKDLFAEKPGGFKDFSGFMLLLGSLLVLFWGYDAMIHKDYLEFMTGFIHRKKLFLSIILSRTAAILLFSLFNMGTALALLKINGINLSSREAAFLVIYLGVMVSLNLFFLSLGTFAGSLKSRFAGLCTVIVSWFALVFLLPGTVNAIIVHKAGNITSHYQLELEKLKKMMDIEKLAIDSVGPAENWRHNEDAVRKFLDHVWDNEFKEILDLEKKLEWEMMDNIRHFQALSCFFPSTFYLSTADEISSKGFESFILFYRHVRVLKEKFVRFYLDKIYFSSPVLGKNPLKNNNPGNFAQVKIEPFLKGSEYLFYSEGHLPGYFILGISLTLLYTVGLFIVSYCGFTAALRK